MLVSKFGNSFLASGLHEYIDAPSSVTIVYFTSSGLKNSVLMSSVSHSSVSRHAVPFPKAIRQHLKTIIINSKYKNQFPLNHIPIIYMYFQCKHLFIYELDTLNLILTKTFLSSNKV